MPSHIAAPTSGTRADRGRLEHVLRAQHNGNGAEDSDGSNGVHGLGWEGWRAPFGFATLLAWLFSRTQRARQGRSTELMRAATQYARSYPPSDLDTSRGRYLPASASPSIRDAGECVFSSSICCISIK